jgi:NAD(P)-dependent dehydrogenase (short-subunit alcohol dehydrogenase family)
MIWYIKQFIAEHFIFPTANLPIRTTLADKVFVVTGASRGIGKAIVETLISRSARVVAVSRSVDLDTASIDKKHQQNLLMLSGDVTIESDVETIIRKTIETFGRIDGLINNAGVNIFKPLEMTSVEEFETIAGVNIKGAFLMSKQVIPHMKSREEGLIINVGSKISHNTQVGPNKTLYAMTKYALEGFSFALNRELKSFGIRVSCLMPGTVNTFVSLSAKEYLSPYQVAEMVVTVAEMEHIDFESIVFKSKNQDI